MTCLTFVHGSNMLPIGNIKHLSTPDRLLEKSRQS